MSKAYYVNKNSDQKGDHEVHQDGCNWMPDFLNRKFLGYFNSCHGAVLEAKKTYPNSNGCYHCSQTCHTS